eukprot:s1298_g4.t1
MVQCLSLKSFSAAADKQHHSKKSTRSHSSGFIARCIGPTIFQHPVAGWMYRKSCANHWCCGKRAGDTFRIHSDMSPTFCAIIGHPPWLKVQCGARMLAPPSWMLAPEHTGGAEQEAEEARLRHANSFAAAAARDEEMRQFVAAEAQLRALAVHPDFHTDEDRILAVIAEASALSVGLEASPPADSKAMDDAQRLLKTMLGLSTAWFRLVANGGFVEGSDGLRGAKASKFTFGIVESLLASSSGLGPSMTLAFQELGGLSFMGKALANVDQASFPHGLNALRVAAARLGAAARQGVCSTEALSRSMEEFRGSLLEKVQGFASSPNRRFHMRDLKEMITNIAGVFDEGYSSIQVFEMSRLLSMHCAMGLFTYREKTSAAEVLDWFAASLIDLLSKRSGGALTSGPSVSDWLEDVGFWKRLLTQMAAKVLLQVHPILTALLHHRACSTRQLAESLVKAGAFTKGSVPSPCRAAIQSSLLLAASALDTEVILQLLADLCDLLGFENLSHEGVDLTTRLAILAFHRGYQVRLGDAASERMPAASFFLRFLQWGYRKEGPKEPGHFEVVDYAQNMLINVLLHHPAMSEILPAITAHALALAVEPCEGSLQAAGRCNKALGAVALAASGIATVGKGRVSPDTAAAVLCSAFPRVGTAAPFDQTNKEYWVSTLVDSFCLFLRLPHAEIAGKEVATLWSRLVVRPVFGLSVPFAAAQYFKMAFMAQPSPSATILAPFVAAPNPPYEISLAYASFYHASHAQAEEEPPSTPPCRLFPQAAFFDPEDRDFGPVLSPPRLPQPLRHSMSSDGYDEHWVDLTTSASIAKAAATAGISMAEPSTSVPRMRLDRVQAAHGSQSNGIFGELTVYDATERRLWDEFDELGRIDDVEALRQRDAAAHRCLAALDKEIDTVGRAGRELPSALAEARAKFSLLCQLVDEGAGAAASQRIRQVDKAFSKAEDELIAATSVHRRTLARCRRQGETPPAEDLSTARTALIGAHLELVKEIRLAAQYAQLGLVEITGTPGFARAIRAAGPAHADPLLERLLRHKRWCDQQATSDPEAAAAPRSQEPERTKEDFIAAEALLDNAELIDPSMDNQSTGNGDVSPIGTSGRSKLVRRRASQAVVLKAFAPEEKDGCLQEIRALQKLKDHPNVISLVKVLKSGDGTMYLELPFCSGGSMFRWCERFGPAIRQGDPDTFVRCLSIWRQIWQAVGYLHVDGVYHGRLTLDAMLLTADQRPVLADFQNCLVTGTGRPTELRLSVPDYTAPELEVQASAVPTAASDVYSAGVAMTKAFMGVELEVSSCLYHPTRGQRSLPEERTDVDLVDLLQQLLAQTPGSRPTAPAVASHRALDPAGFLRRRGLLGTQSPGLRTPAQAFLEAAEALREEYRGRRVDEPLMFSREAVFDAISASKVGEWREDALLGEWRVMLNDESGVDGGGLRREVVSLFFEQLESSSLVMRAGMDGSEVVTLFINDRRRADKSPQQWRHTWTSVGAMLLRALVHFGNAPLAFSSAIFDCALGRFCKLPPDDVPGGDDDDDAMASVDRLLQLREEKGDDWARSELLDLLRRLRRADPQKEAGYRWMLSQRMQEEQNGVMVYSLSAESMETITAMLEPRSSSLLSRVSSGESGESVMLPDASLEWVLLWDVYLKFLGGGDRWLAYEALADGFTAHGRRHDMWSQMTGDQVIETLEGVALTADVILPNLEFKPNYGYETQIQFFKNVIAEFDSEELSMFLRFSTGIGRLPASRRFPAGQKLTVRFMPDQLEHLPSAHTCFWVVDVPPYEDQEDMARKLRLAIAAPQPFALS